MILRTEIGVLAALLAGCSSTAGAPAGPSILASAWPIAGLVTSIVGDAATVTDLTPAGVEPHDLELTAADLERFERADLVVYIGGGFQPAIEDAIPEGRGVDLLDFAGALLEGGPHDVERDARATDPHVWLDPARWADVAVALGSDLATRLGTPDIVSRTAEVAGTLDALNGEFETALGGCARDLLLTEHEAFGYLAARYDLNERALTGIAPEAEATAPRITELRRLADDEGVTTVFAEPGSGSRLARTLAEEAGLAIAELDPLERSSGDATYLERMRANLEELHQALGCR